MFEERLSCPCPWFDGTAEGCQKCSELPECGIYACLVILKKQVKPQTECFRVIMSEICNEGENAEPGDICGTFLTYDEAFEFVGWCMVNDIGEFGCPDVYQILHIDNTGHIVSIVELDNDEIESPCRKPTYSAFGCLGCTQCKEDDEVKTDEEFPDWDEILSDDSLPF